jgi:hypothetical protein
MATFGITSPTALFHKLREEQADFERVDCLSSRHAINAIMTAYHLHEWVWGDFVKKRLDLHAAWQLVPAGKAKYAHFKSWLQKKCPAMIDAEAVTNGTKHFGEHVPTGEHKGVFDRNVFQNDAFDVSYLWIECGGREQRAEDFIRELVEFWEKFFAEHKDIP